MRALNPRYILASAFGNDTRHPKQEGYRIERAAEDDSGLGDEAVLGSFDDCIPTRVHQRRDQNDDSDEGIHEGSRRVSKVVDGTPPSKH